MGGDGNSMATTKKEVLPAGGGPSEDGKKIMAVVRVLRAAEAGAPKI